MWTHSSSASWHPSSRGAPDFGNVRQQQTGGWDHDAHSSNELTMMQFHPPQEYVHSQAEWEDMKPAAASMKPKNHRCSAKKRAFQRQYSYEEQTSSHELLVHDNHGQDHQHHHLHHGNLGTSFHSNHSRSVQSLPCSPLQSSYPAPYQNHPTGGHHQWAAGAAREKLTSFSMHLPYTSSSGHVQQQQQQPQANHNRQQHQTLHASSFHPAASLPLSPLDQCWKYHAEAIMQRMVDFCQSDLEQVIQTSPFLRTTPVHETLALLERSEILTQGVVLGKGGFSLVLEITGIRLQESVSRRLCRSQQQLRQCLADQVNAGQIRLALKHLQPSLLDKVKREVWLQQQNNNSSSADANGNNTAAAALQKACKEFGYAAADLAVEAAYLSRLDSSEHVLTARALPVHSIASFQSSHDDYFIVLDRLDCTLDQTLTAASSSLSASSMHRQEAAQQRLSTALEHALQLARALEYLHENRIVFRDLKPQNIGFLQDRLVLFDFGLARELPALSTRNGENDESAVFHMSGVGTRRYMAVEMITTQQYNCKADCYSWAMVLWEMLTTEKPFATLSPDQHLQQVCHEGLRPALSPSWPANVCRLLQSSWDANLASRWNSSRLVQVATDCILSLTPSSRTNLASNHNNNNNGDALSCYSQHTVTSASFAEDPYEFDDERDDDDEDDNIDCVSPVGVMDVETSVAFEAEPCKPQSNTATQTGTLSQNQQHHHHSQSPPPQRQLPVRNGSKRATLSTASLLSQLSASMTFATGGGDNDGGFVRKRTFSTNSKLMEHSCSSLFFGEAEAEGAAGQQLQQQAQPSTPAFESSMLLHDLSFSLMDDLSFTTTSSFSHENECKEDEEDDDEDDEDFRWKWNAATAAAGGAQHPYHASPLSRERSWKDGSHLAHHHHGRVNHHGLLAVAQQQQQHHESSILDDGPSLSSLSLCDAAL